MNARQLLSAAAAALFLITASGCARSSGARGDWRESIGGPGRCIRFPLQGSERCGYARGATPAIDCRPGTSGYSGATCPRGAAETYPREFA